MKKTIMTITVLFFLLSCKEKQEIISFDSKIMFAGNALYHFNMSNNKKEKLLEKKEFLIRHISKIDNKNILVSLYQLSPTKNRNTIEVWRMDSKKTPYKKGSKAVYFKKHDTIIYYNEIGDLVTSRFSEKNKTEYLIEKSNKFQPKPAILTSEETFIFVKELQGKYSIAEHNVLTKTTTILNNFKECSLDKSIWLKKSKQLLCQQRDSNGRISGIYFLITKQGHKSKLNFSEKGFWPVASIQDDKKILLQNVNITNLGTQEIYPLWIYDIKNSSYQKVAFDIYII